MYPLADGFQFRWKGSEGIGSGILAIYFRHVVVIVDVVVLGEILVYHLSLLQVDAMLAAILYHKGLVLEIVDVGYLRTVVKILADVLLQIFNEIGITF